MNMVDRLGGASSALAFKAPCRLGTTANITLEGFQTVDGVLPPSGDSIEHPDLRRILVKNQTDAAQNGIYIMDVGTWARAKDFDSVIDIRQGTRVYVYSGSTQSGGYIVTSSVDPSSFEIDDDDIDFAAEVTSGAVSELLFQAFQTKAAVEAATITATTLFLQTLVYSAAVDGGGARYKRVISEPAHEGKIRSLDRFLPDGTTSASNGGWWELMEPVLATTMFGMSSAGTAAANMTALKAAIAALSDGQVLCIPEMGGIATIDTTGGLTGAAEIDQDDVTIIIDGHIQANYSDEESNPAYIFKTTGRNIKFRGSGTIEGDGEFHVGGVTSLNFPGLVYVQGDNFSCEGLKLRRPPQTAFMVVGDNASICHNHFEGGPITWEASTIPPAYTLVNPDYDGSGHFHIVATGSVGHDFSHNRFLPDEDGGSVVNAIFSAGVAGVASYCRVQGNYCLNAWEKLFYGYGDRNIVVGNNIVAVYPYGYTDAIRVWGNYSIVAFNTIDGYRGACQMLDSLGSKFVYNNCINLRDSGVNVQHFTSIADGFTGTVAYNVVKGNLIIRDSAQAGDPRFGIRVHGHADGHIFGCEVTENILANWGTAETEYALQINAGTGTQIQKSKCNDNFMVSCASGILATRFSDGQVNRNRFYDMSDVWIHVSGGDSIQVDANRGSAGGTYGLSQSTGSDVPTNVRYTNNHLFGLSNIAIRNYSFGSASENWAEGNQWTAKALVGGATLSSAATSTITHGGVAPHATITLIPTSAGFATLVGSTKSPYTGVSSNDFVVTTANSTPAVGTETFRYKIIQ